MKSGTNIPCLGAFLLLGIGGMNAQTTFQPPEGGWDYAYEGDAADYADGFAALDGTWSHDNSSDEWDGSAIGGEFGADNRPGGAMTITENGIDYLRIQDTGDPRDYDFSDPGSNRKIYFGHNLTDDGASETVLDDGVTLHFRARVPTDGPLDALHPDGQQRNGAQPYPDGGDGYVTSNGGKGNFVIKQQDGGAIAFSLTTASDTPGGNPNQFVTRFAGLSMNEFAGNEISEDVNFGQGDGKNVIPFDPTQWHEFWIVIQRDEDNVGTHVASIYIDGNTAPQVFKMTAGDGGEGQYSEFSYLAMGSTATPQSAALDVDFCRVKLGAVPPPGASANPPPSYANLSPEIGANFVDVNQGVTFTATSSGSIPRENIRVVLNGRDWSGNLKITGNEQEWNVQLTGLPENGIYEGNLTVTDADGASITGILSFNTFSKENKTFEAEDFNFDNGMFIDNPTLDSTDGNSYFDKGAGMDSEGVDFHELSDEFDRANEDAVWRLPNVGNMPSTVDNGNEANRAAYKDAGEADYSVNDTEVGEWLNYTRRFDAGNFNIYLRAADGGPFVVRLDRVTGDAGQPNQTTELLGAFRSEGVPGGGYQWIPLSDESESLSSIRLEGTITLRATIVEGSPDLNFFMVAPAVEAVAPPMETILSIALDGDQVTIRWEGESVLATAAALDGVWNAIAGASSPHSIKASGEQAFFHVGIPSRVDAAKMVKQQVAAAIARYQEVGRQVFDEISKTDGDYIDGELYVFVLDADGVALAHAANPSLVGQNLYGLQDSTGTFIVQGILEIASPEGSWGDYLFENPLTGNEEPKRSWVVKHDDLIFGSGYYNP